MKKPAKKLTRPTAKEAEVSQSLDAPSESAAKNLKVNELKWGTRLLKGKYTTIPNIIFERQLALRLAPVDINIILHLVSYWWTVDGKPRPAKATIAEAMDLHPRTIQRRIERMEKLGYIRREFRFAKGIGRRPNAYHLDGLIKAATPYADEKVKEMEARRALREAAVGRRGKARVAEPDDA